MLCLFLSFFLSFFLFCQQKKRERERERLGVWNAAVNEETTRRRVKWSESVKLISRWSPCTDIDKREGGKIYLFILPWFAPNFTCGILHLGTEFDCCSRRMRCQGLWFPLMEWSAATRWNHSATATTRVSLDDREWQTTTGPHESSFPFYISNRPRTYQMWAELTSHCCGGVKYTTPHIHFRRNGGPPPPSVLSLI